MHGHYRTRAWFQPASQRQGVPGSTHLSTTTGMFQLHPVVSQLELNSQIMTSGSLHCVLDFRMSVLSNFTVLIEQGSLCPRPSSQGLCVCFTAAWQLVFTKIWQKLCLQQQALVWWMQNIVLKSWKELGQLSYVKSCQSGPISWTAPPHCHPPTHPHLPTPPGPKTDTPHQSCAQTVSIAAQQSQNNLLCMLDISSSPI